MKRERGERLRAPLGVSKTQRGGVCVKFPCRPPDECLEMLKEHGFRYKRTSKAWFHLGTPDNIEVAGEVWMFFSEAMPDAAAEVEDDDDQI